MATYTDTEKFLQAVFPDHGFHAIFAHSVAPKGMAHCRYFKKLDPKRDCYWSVAAFPGDADPTRTNARALGVRALVLDDVGTKVNPLTVLSELGAPTAIVETSLGNFQFVYRLSSEIPVADWGSFFAEIERLVGTPLEGKDAVHLFRLPMGVNTKPGRGGFAPVLTKLEAHLALDIGNINSSVSPSAGKSGYFPTGPGPSEPRVKGIRNLMKLVPNDLGVDRETWVRRAHQIKALAVDDAEGEAAFDDWSAKWPGYDPVETARVWGSIHTVDKTSGLGLLMDAEAADPAGFARVMNKEAASVFDDNPEPPPPNPFGGGGGGGGVAFHLGEKKQILLTMENAARALRGLGLACKYDQFHHRVYIERGGKVERLTDNLVLLLRVEINDVYGKDFGPVHVGDAIMALALRHGFNPVTDMLRGAEALWDGVARLDRLGPDYFHTEDTELARECFRKVMIAAVRRARSPGCKFDQILVTESPEGWDKSSAWAVLAGAENFSDADILGKDARAVQEELADIWIHEIADLSGLSRADIEHVKAFASRTNDRARPAYGRYLLDQARQSIEVGTTNSDSYLLSTTGNRRFWPFRLGAPVDLVRLRADRAMLWGEAAAAESGGETLVLNKKLWGVAGVEQEKRRAVDPWEDELGNLVPMTGPAPVGCERIEVRNGEHFISNLSVSEYLSGYRRQVMNSGSGRKIAEIMKRLGWERCAARVNGMQTRGYKRPIFNSPSVSVSPPVSSNPF